MTTNRVHRPSVSFPAELLPAARESEVDAALAALDALQTDAALDALLPAEGFTTLKPLTKHPDARARRTSWSPGAADVESENDDDVSWSDDAASLDEELREPARVDEVTHACLELLRGGRATRWRSACDAFLALRLRPVSASSLRSSYICARERKDRRHALGAVNAPPRRRARRCPGHAPGAPEGLPRPVCGGTRRGGKSGARAGVRRWRRAGPLRRLRSSAR